MSEIEDVILRRYERRYKRKLIGYLFWFLLLVVIRMYYSYIK
jgi:hypothetical protein